MVARYNTETCTQCIINIHHATNVLRRYGHTSSLADESKTWARLVERGPVYRMRVPASYQLTTEAAGVALGVAAAAAVSVTVLPNRPAIRW